MTVRVGNMPDLNRRRAARWFPSLLLCAAVAGCGEPTDPKYPVSGSISFRGAPVAGGLINFFPQGGGRPLGGPFGEAGTYEVELPRGQYVVTIKAPVPIPEGWVEGDPLPQQSNRIPPRYGQARGSGLSVDVQAADDTQIHDFQLK